MKEQPAKNFELQLSLVMGQMRGGNGWNLDEENSEDTSALDQNSRDFLKLPLRIIMRCSIQNYDTSSDKFQNYYKDVSLRMKNKELDLLIVVNMFLTGFDATTMNTLWLIRI